MEHGKQIRLWNEGLRYVDAAERHKLEEDISQLQRDDRCVRRAWSIMLLQAALAFAGLGFCAVFWTIGAISGGLLAHFIFRMFCMLMLVSAISVPFFLIVAYWNRRKLDQQGEECLRLVTGLLEARSGKLVLAPTPSWIP